MNRIEIKDNTVYASMRSFGRTLIVAMAVLLLAACAREPLNNSVASLAFRRKRG